MNKKEQAAFDANRFERDMARAMRWPEYDKPVPMTIEQIRAEIEAGNTKEFNDEFFRGGKIRAFVGWGFYFHREESRVYSVAVTRTSRAIIEDDGRAVSWSRDGNAVYRTEADALRALRHTMTERFSSLLAVIDSRIKAVTA